jgi:hypothetical protein
MAMEFPLPSVEKQEELVEYGKASIKKMINEFFPKDEEEHKTFRLAVKQLLPMMCNNPASPSTKWHGAWPGGLLAHTVEVIELGLMIGELLFPDVQNTFGRDRISWQRSIIKACFFHDVGKVGDLEESYYHPQENEWRRNNLGEMYEINRDQSKLTYLPIPVRGLWIAQRFGVKLTTEETQAIIASDGPATPYGKAVVASFLEDPLSAVVHFTDKWVSQVRGA